MSAIGLAPRNRMFPSHNFPDVSREAPAFAPIPKSMSSIRSSLSIMMFSGFQSRDITPCR
jgi:hypothetical protein